MDFHEKYDVIDDPYIVFGFIQINIYVNDKKMQVHIVLAFFLKKYFKLIYYIGIYFS